MRKELRKIWYPLQSKQVKDIYEHLSVEEIKELYELSKPNAVVYGGIMGIVLAGTLFALRSVASSIILQGLFYILVFAILAAPAWYLTRPWRRQQKKFLANTRYAREKGYSVNSLRLYRFEEIFGREQITSPDRE